MNSHEPLLELTLEDFANSFGTTVHDFPEDFKDLIAKFDFRYRKCSSEERDKVILDILKILESDDLKVSGRGRKADWERGWVENLQNFRNSGYSLTELVPKYIRPGQYVRLNRDYVIPCDDNFELNYSDILRTWLFTKYLKNMEAVYEFGCGTGYHLARLAEMYPEKKLHGLDWIDASRQIVDLLAKRHSLNTEGHLFDFFSPDERLEIAGNSAIFTWGALEQLGSNYEAFLQFLLKKAPAVCLNVECLGELYDKDNLVDYLADQYRKKRNYLDGYLTRLHQLEADGKIIIEKVQRLYFGSLYHEVYSFVVWKPLI